MRRLATIAVVAVLTGGLPGGVGSGSATAQAEPHPDCLEAPSAGGAVPSGNPGALVDRYLGRVSSTAAGCLPEGVHLPNLVPSAPTFVTIGRAGQWWDTLDPLDLFHEPPPQGDVLKFTTVIVNRGAYAFDIFSEPATDPGVWTAHQCVRWDGPVCLARESVGEIVWHAEHRHWHFENFVLYELRDLTPDGEPDFSQAGLVASSGKISFCLQDSSRQEGDEPRFYDRCLGVIQGISSGWADIYDSGVPGQHLDINGVADGEYALVYTVDPDRRLHETDDVDNAAWSVIEIYNQGTQARVVD